jgi:competence protein ComEA
VAARVPLARSSIVITGPGAATPLPMHATVLGAVYSRGAYTLPTGSRVKDLVEAAGGAQANADLSHVDLASPLTDGQTVYVPSVGEATPLLVGGRININVINVATADQLHAALGISITEARRIVSYRQRHGRFNAVSDLLLIPISQVIYDRIKNLVTV